MKHALRGIATIGRLTLLESLRNRLILATLLVGGALVGASVAAASVSYGEQARIIVDLGLATTSALAGILGIAMTVSTFSRELSQRTAYTLIVRPIPRWSFVLGKYFGALATLVVVVTVTHLATAMTVLFYGSQPGLAFWASWWLSIMEATTVVAIALLFSTFASPVFASAYSAGLIIAGHLSRDLQSVANKMGESDAIAAALLGLTHSVVPDFQTMSLRSQAANGLPVPSAFVFHASLYACAYAATAMAIATFVFSRRKSM